MKPQSAKPSLSVDEDSLRSTSTTASSISRASARSSSGSQVEQGCIYNMSDCYERLRAMVPDIPARRRMSKVEILQHVIDYIQDLESALELPHLQTNNFVKDSTNRTDRESQADAKIARMT
ncbi:DNA-binding protein inhibitor ID-3-B-like [Orbicella faveolata]|uniref:DNA-binding protein inhibitor ID-3-B-like n=1 Tax=Orbicella faveolata TaxID=48498 RepID=UPI0009E642D3|nr:DNA-binding protein inhibitor ID-3-B-like [Orbicella faveolata]